MRPTGTYDVSYSKDMAIVRTPLQWGLLAVFFAFLIAFPHFSGEYVLSVATLTGISLIAVFGLHITTGLCGQINLGQAAFMGVGAYTSAILTTVGVPFILALPCAGIMAGITGVIFGAPSLRVKELYLAMATLAAQFIIVYIILRIDNLTGMKLTGGALGLRVPWASVGDFVFDSTMRIYYLVAAVAVIAGLVARNITRSRVGRAFIAVRDNDLAAEVMGVDLFTYKLLAFFTGCFFAGIAGSLWAHYLTYLQPAQFPLKDSVWMVGMLVIGGMGSTLGAVMGTIFIRLIDVLTYYISPLLSGVFPQLPTNISFAVSLVVFSIAIIFFLVFEPRGLSHRWGIFKASYRLWPYSY
jgi:branched-chain amino acid transport system permease protein